MNIDEKVINIISHLLRIKREEIKFESSFFKDLETDSLDTVELVIAIEEEFNIEITDKEIDEMSVVEDLIKIVRKIKEK